MCQGKGEFMEPTVPALNLILELGGVTPSELQGLQKQLRDLVRPSWKAQGLKQAIQAIASQRVDPVSKVM